MFNVPRQTISLSPGSFHRNSCTDIVSAIDKGYVVALALLDLSSVFDIVDHTLLLYILENRFSVTGTNLEWFRSCLRSHADIHCWLNFYISSPPCFVCSTRFRSESSWIHRIHWNHYRHFLQSPYPVPPICWWHTRLRLLLRHWCPSAIIPPVGLCQRLEFTLFITLPAAQLSKNYIHQVWLRSNLAKISSE